MWHGLEGVGWGWLSVGFVHMALLWLLVAVCVAILLWLVRRRPDGTALEILEMRYAKGEITQEELERMKRNLTGTQPPSSRGESIESTNERPTL